jgi:hypothetical protein
MGRADRLSPPSRYDTSVTNGVKRHPELIPHIASPNGFTASDIAIRVRERCAPYGPRHAAYDLKKLRRKHIVCRIAHTQKTQCRLPSHPHARKVSNP